jgi:hypothetical protein
MRKRYSEDDETCRWDTCDDPQFEDWYYCEFHAGRIEWMNRAIWAVTGR